MIDSLAETAEASLAEPNPEEIHLGELDGDALDESPSDQITDPRVS